MSISPKITNTSRISPLCSSINKNLLTPCRRIGLSRKRKTPNSVVQMLSENSSISSSDSLSAETTPVNYGKSVKKNVSRSVEITSLSENSQLAKRKEIDLIDSNIKPVDKKMHKKGLFQAYSEDLFESDLSHTSSNNLEEDLQVDFIKLATKMPSTEILTPQNMSPEVQKSLENKPHPIKISEEDETYQDNDFNDDFNITNKYNRNQKRQRYENRKTVKRTLLKKSESLIGKESEDTTSMDQLNMTKECIVQLHKISENDIDQQKNYNPNPTESCNSKSIEVIDEEEYAFTSTPEQEKSKKSDMLEKTKALERIIEQKRQQLVDLKRASIYKRKHSIEDLNELTSKWMAGCKSGLHDLLTQLQAHGAMDMTTLLQNLHIPRDIVTKLAL